MKGIIIGLIIWFLPAIQKVELPAGFVYLSDIAPGVVVDLRYNSPDNFMGKRIDGYLSNRCIITEAAAMGLKKVQLELNSMDLGLKVYDAYRPQMAVDHFVRWAGNLKDTLQKSGYYPKVPKSELFKRGYISARSGHTRGSTVDLTIVYLRGSKKGQEVDMGTNWDFFSEKSWPDSDLVTSAQKDNRVLLRKVMMKHGFKPYEAEWWHFTLEDEPFPDTYFNFPVE